MEYCTRETRNRFEFCVVYRQLVSVRTFSVMYDQALPCSQISKSDIMPYTICTVSLLTEDGNFNLPQGSVNVYMG